jgi:hypothetical protein
MDIWHCSGCANIWTSTAGATNKITLGYIAVYGGALGAAELAPVLEAYGPAALSHVESLLQTAASIGQQIEYDPRTANLVNDFLSNYAPGAIPATAGGLAGFVVTGWDDLKKNVQDLYQEAKGSIPH